MGRRLYNIFRHYLKNDSGNLTLATAVMSFVIIAAIAVAIDSSRMTQAKSILRDANDAATLAAAREFQKTQSEREAIYKGVLNTMLSGNNAVEEYNSEIDFTETKGTVTLNSEVRGTASFIFPNFTMKNLEITVQSQAFTGKTKLEIALALDVSSTMTGARLEEMQEAASRFVEIILKDSFYKDNATISIIPYGGTVRLPKDMRGLLKPPSTTAHWVGNKWNGCLSLRPAEHSEGLNPKKRYEYMADFTVWSIEETWCPPKGNELLGLTNQSTILFDKIEALNSGVGGGGDHGMAWAFSSLDPNWRGQFPNTGKDSPHQYNNKFKKVILYMTDGRVTQQYSPILADLTGLPPFVTKNKEYDGDYALNGFYNFCDLAKSNDIEIYTIGFDIKNAAARKSLKNCATTEYHYHEAKLRQLEEVYEDIAGYLSALRLTQ